ncbi:MAG: hypothetical protein WC786_05455 [Patescibacteria group bacterium]|jgi:hypothetical protein
MHCIYCGSTGPFNKEHVIPQFLGTFTPVNPTLQGADGLVCQRCNSVVFSALETEFKEDTWEGITGQMLNFLGANSIRIRGINVTMEFFSGMGDNFFDEIFPFLKQQDGKFVVDPKAQVKIKNYGGEHGYQVFALEALQRLKDEAPQSRTKLEAFNRVKKRLRMSGRDNIAVFVGGNAQTDDGALDRAIVLLGDFGVTYRERERKFAPVGVNPDAQFEVQMQVTITPNICRLIAKVAFNYFVCCALQEGRQAILYDTRFDRIKRFILGDTAIQRKDVIVEVSDEPITIHEKESGRRYVGHTIVFYQENNLQYARVSFFGGKVYKVLLGQALPEFLNPHFGCGHLFYPFNQTIHNLAQHFKANPTAEELRQSFGLFRRLDLSGQR